MNAELEYDIKLKLEMLSNRITKMHLRIQLIEMQIAEILGEEL